MKYKVEYTLQRKVVVYVEVEDKELNDAFERLGPIGNDKDFLIDSYDPRWGIENLAYDKFSGGESEDDSEDSIENRTITKCED